MVLANAATIGDTVRVMINLTLSSVQKSVELFSHLVLFVEEEVSIICISHPPLHILQCKCIAIGCCRKHRITVSPLFAHTAEDMSTIQLFNLPKSWLCCTVSLG